MKTADKTEQTNRLARYSTIFISLLTLVVLVIINRGGELLSTALFSFVTISGIFLASTRTKEILITLIMAIPWLILSWIKLLFSTNLLPPIISSLLLIVFLGFITFLIFRHLITAEKVTADLLFGSASAYLMLGILFALMYSVLAIYNPDTVRLPDGALPKINNLLYFSFTTLTTLGYGDILPASDSAKALAIIEAIVGVLFTAIVIARLMGLYISEAQHKKAD